MKRLRVNKKHDLKKLNGLLFFAECLEELLFVFGNDSFKAPALNSVTRIFELRNRTEAAIATRRTKSLFPILDELSWSLENDHAIKLARDRGMARQLLVRIRGLLETEDAAPLREAISDCNALLLILSNYRDKLESSLRQALIDGVKKNEIWQLASSFIVQLEVEGFSRRFMTYVVRSELVRPFALPIEIDSEKALTKFFQSFNRASRKYEIYIRCSSDYSSLPSDAMLVVTEENQEPKKLARISDPSLPVLMKTKPIEARDAISARESAYRFVKIASSLSKFYSHRLALRAGGVCIVREIDTGAELVVREPVDAMMRGTDASTGVNVQKRIDGLFHAISKLSHQSKRLLFKAVSYHQEAIETTSLENKLLDLWAALEGFLPQPSDDKPRIVHYLEYMLPSLTLSYSFKLFRYVSNGLFHASGDIRRQIEAIGVDGAFDEKVGALILCPEFADVRDSVLGQLDGHPLLRYRMFRLYEEHKDCEQILKTIRAHKAKVSWHIHRIYGMRNSIMHNAEALPYLETLVENLHGYLDLTINTVVAVALSASRQTSITATLKYVEVSERQYVSELENAISDNIELNATNWQQYVFGPIARQMLVAFGVSDEVENDPAPAG